MVQDWLRTLNSSSAKRGYNVILWATLQCPSSKSVCFWRLTLYSDILERYWEIHLVSLLNLGLLLCAVCSKRSLARVELLGGREWWKTWVKAGEMRVGRLQKASRNVISKDSGEDESETSEQDFFLSKTCLNNNNKTTRPHPGVASWDL